ncbi:MAG: hypothetical protein H0W15_07120 [Gemmatimonadales bacterium]|nr:hypothetical protein [Gemmatimonadales bacterium]
MRRLALILLLAACSGTPEQATAPDLDRIAHQYVRLVLGMGHHDPDYVDAYYGPDSLKAAADRDSLDLSAIRSAADSLIAELGDAMPTDADSMLVMRHRYLRTQLGALITRTRMVGGEQLTFDQEARGLYGTDVPAYDPAQFDEQLARLDSLLPGPGPLAERYQQFRERVMIPPERLDTVFKVAIAACRARSGVHIALPPAERFDLEYVKGTSWNAYNWYKGDSHSLIQVNTDFPTPVDRAVDLACHEGYPGHHVYNASLEQALVRERGWVEMSVYPLFSPQSLIAEGSANYGIDMAFPGEQRTAFERDTLFPLAGLDPSFAERNASVRLVMERLNHARNEVARQYLDGVVDADSAKTLMTRWWLQTPEGAAKTLRFIDTYRSYVINYNLGRDMVAAYVERNAGGDPARRWAVFGELLSSPRLPADLVAGP